MNNSSRPIFILLALAGLAPLAINLFGADGGAPAAATNSAFADAAAALSYVLGTIAGGLGVFRGLSLVGKGDAPFPFGREMRSAILLTLLGCGLLGASILFA